MVDSLWSIERIRERNRKMSASHAPRTVPSDGKPLSVIAYTFDHSRLATLSGRRVFMTASKLSAKTVRCGTSDCDRAYITVQS